MLKTLLSVAGVMGIWLVATAPLVRAQTDITFGYYEKSPLQIGRGIDIRTPLQTKLEALQPDFKALWADGAKVEYRLKFSTEAGSVATTEDIDLSMAGEAAFGFGGFGADMKSKEQFSRYKNRLVTHDSVILTVETRVDFGRKMIDNPHLQPEANQLLREKPAEFVERYGTHCVVSENHRASLAVHIRIGNLSEKLKQDLKTEYSSSFSGNWVQVVKGSASLNGHFYSLLETASKSGQVGVELDSTGIEPADLKGFKTPTPDNLNLPDILASAESFLASLKRESSPAVSFQLASYASLFGAPPIKLDAKRREFFNAAFRLGLTYNAQLELLATERAGLDAIKSEQGRELSARLQGLENRYQLALERLSEIVQLALKDSDFSATVKPENLEEVYAFRDPFSSVQVVASPDYSKGYLDAVSLILELRLRYPPTIERIEVFREKPGKLTPEPIYGLTFAKSEDQMRGRIDDYRTVNVSARDPGDLEERANNLLNVVRDVSYFVEVTLRTGDLPVRVYLPKPSLTDIKIRK